MVAGALGGGGVEAVVSVLARGLPAHGIAVEVACTDEGRTSAELRRSGVLVHHVRPADLPALIADRAPHVIQLHRPDRELVAAVLEAGIPVVPVFHAIESYLNGVSWATLSDLASRSPVGIAVSGRVKTFFEQRLNMTGIRVVLNGVPPLLSGGVLDRHAARQVVSRALEADFDDNDVLVVALQRYSDQKNAAGLVDAFLGAVARDPRLRLVVAGAPDNWLEVRRADLLRRSSAHGARVHLLGDSDPSVLLRAGDMYVLDSFAEGGPLSAVEAVMAGLPVVLSDVGFAHELVSSPGVRGVVVRRASQDYSQPAMAAQRRRRHQSNRDEFSAAILEVASLPRGAVGDAPQAFREEAMLRGHADALRAAVVCWPDRARGAARLGPPPDSAKFPLRPRPDKNAVNNHSKNAADE